MQEQLYRPVRCLITQPERETSVVLTIQACRKDRNLHMTLVQAIIEEAIKMIEALRREMILIQSILSRDMALL